VSSVQISAYDLTSKVAIGPMQPQWCATYLVARHEKKVAEQLRRRSVESFLPLYREVHYWNKRKAEVDMPMFPSYIFVRIGPGDRLRVLEVPGVVQIVNFNGIPAYVPDPEIEALKAALQTRKCEPCEYLPVGKRVRVGSGALMGLEGQVIRQQSSSRIVVSMDFIQRSVSVELETSDLECLS